MHMYARTCFILTKRFAMHEPLTFAQRHHSGILMTGGGGGGGGGLTEVHILFPENPNFRICLPKSIPAFLAYPKNSHTNSKLLCYC